MSPGPELPWLSQEEAPAERESPQTPSEPSCVWGGHGGVFRGSRGGCALHSCPLPVPVQGRGLDFFGLVSGSGLAGGSAHSGAQTGLQGQVRRLQQGLQTLGSRREHCDGQ